MKNIYILAMFLFVCQPSHAQIRDYQTTRLISTSGAGVASILSTEAAILNPASAAFFEENTASIDYAHPKLDDKSDERNERFPKHASSQGFFVSDNKGPVKGGLAYTKQKENNFERERISMHAASILGKNAAFGLNYQYLQDTFPRTHKSRRDFSHVLNAGLTYVLTNDLTVGVVAKDITRTLAYEDRIITGMQYALTSKINLIADYAFLASRDFSKHFSWATGLQLALIKDLYVRGGLFEDQISHFKGYSWGASWVGPRLGMEIAQRFSEQTSKGNYLYTGETLIDSSVSFFIRF